MIDSVIIPTKVGWMFMIVNTGKENGGYFGGKNESLERFSLL